MAKDIQIVAMSRPGGQAFCVPIMAQLPQGFLQQIFLLASSFTSSFTSPSSKSGNKTFPICPLCPCLKGLGLQPPHLPSQGTKMAKLSISIAQIHQKVWIHMACLLFLLVKPCVGAKTQNFISSSAFFPEKLSSSFTAASSSSFCLCKLPSLKNGHGRNSPFHKIDKHHRPIETLQSSRKIMIFRYI